MMARVTRHGPGRHDRCQREYAERGERHCLGVISFLGIDRLNVDH